MIWEACIQPRTIDVRGRVCEQIDELYIIPGPDSDIIQQALAYTLVPPAPAVLHICRESREVGLRFKGGYVKAFGDLCFPDLVGDGGDDGGDDGGGDDSKWDSSDSGSSLSGDISDISIAIDDTSDASIADISDAGDDANTDGDDASNDGNSDSGIGRGDDLGSFDDDEVSRDDASDASRDNASTSRDSTKVPEGSESASRDNTNDPTNAPTNAPTNPPSAPSKTYPPYNLRHIWVNFSLDEIDNGGQPLRRFREPDRSRIQRLKINVYREPEAVGRVFSLMQHGEFFSLKEDLGDFGQLREICLCMPCKDSPMGLPPGWRPKSNSGSVRRGRPFMKGWRAVEYSTGWRGGDEDGGRNDGERGENGDGKGEAIEMWVLRLVNVEMEAADGGAS